MDQKYDGLLLVAVLLVLLLATWAGILDKQKLSEWGTLILGALLSWIRSGNKGVDASTQSGDVNVKEGETP